MLGKVLTAQSGPSKPKKKKENKIENVCGEAKDYIYNTDTDTCQQVGDKYLRLAQSKCLQFIYNFIINAALFAFPLDALFSEDINDTIVA